VLVVSHVQLYDGTEVRQTLFPEYDNLSKGFASRLDELDSQTSAHLNIQLDETNHTALINTHPEYRSILALDFAQCCGQLALYEAGNYLKQLGDEQEERVLRLFQNFHHEVVWNEDRQPLEGNPPSLDIIKEALLGKVERITAMGVAQATILAVEMADFLKSKHPALSNEERFDIVLVSDKPLGLFIRSADIVQEWMVNTMCARPDHEPLPLNASFIGEVMKRNIPVSHDFWNLAQRPNKREIVLNGALLQYPGTVPYRAEMCPMARIKIKELTNSGINVASYKPLWRIVVKTVARIAPELYTQPATLSADRFARYS